MILPIAIAAAIVVLMMIFTGADGAVSGALAGKARWFARSFETIGQLPFVLVVLVAPQLLFFCGKTRAAWVRVLMAVPAFASSALGAFFAAFQTAMYIHGEEGFEPKAAMPWLALAALALVAATALVLRRIDRGRLVPARRFALIGLCLVFADVLTVETLKNTFGRARPREIGVDGAVFGRWFELHGKTGRKSFPSGHSAYAFGAVVWAFLFKEGGAARRKTFRLGLLFGALTALSRVLIAAHWPTDVTAGAAITLAYVGVLAVIFKDKERLA
ncbi:MAG: phosphatase PAP2 family protein [Spirochaetaceae bacterium]|nr:phosphatase PAP2 family protein [Spirochaetaceae bacterium]